MTKATRGLGLINNKVAWHDHDYWLRSKSLLSFVVDNWPVDPLNLRDPIDLKPIDPIEVILALLFRVKEKEID